MSTQDGMYVAHDLARFLIHASELKLWHFEVFQYVYVGKPYICNVFGSK